MLEPQDVRRVNAAFAEIPLTEARLRELPGELAQFQAVMERVRGRLAFAEEPASFVAALSACAQETER